MTGWSQENLADALEANLPQFGAPPASGAWELAGRIRGHFAAVGEAGVVAGQAAEPPPLVGQSGRREWLNGFLGERVTITNSRLGTSWTGRVIALHDDPGVVIEQDGGFRLCLPQSFEVTRAAP